MRVALVNPPSRNDVYYDSGYCCIHLGLGYIASALEKQGHRVDIYECSLRSINSKQIGDILFDIDYDAIGFTTYYFNIMQVYRISMRLKKRKSCFIFAGGIFASMNYEEIMQNPYIDCCVLGEGEESVVELVNKLQNNEKLENLMGIVIRKDSHLLVTEKRTCVQNLDLLEFPKRVYFFKGKISSMIASRGCNGNCSFCGITDYYRNYTTRNIRIRTPQNVVDEMVFINRKYGVQYIYFQDENILSTLYKNPKWVVEFHDEVVKQRLNMSFYAYARADDIMAHKEEVQLLKEAGLNCIFIGIESFVERQLKLYEKRIKPDVNIETLNFVRGLGLNINMGFILFDPFLTIEEFKQNVKCLLEVRFYELCYWGQAPISLLDPLYPMSNTRFRQSLIDAGIYDESIFHKYKFINEDIQYLFEKLQGWRDIVREKYMEIDLCYKGIDFWDFTRSELYMEKLRKLLKVDVEFLDEMVNCCYRDENVWEFIIRKYSNKVGKIYV